MPAVEAPASSAWKGSGYGGGNIPEPGTSLTQVQAGALVPRLRLISDPKDKK